MNKAITNLHALLRALAAFSLRRAAFVVAASLALTAVSVWYAATRIAIETNTDALIDSELPFRQTYEDFNRAFPQFSNSFTAVIDAPSPEAAEAAQGAFAAALLENGRHYKSVFAPGRGEFFEREGFLLLDIEKLVTLTDELAAAEPVLAAVSEDPSLRGLFAVLNEGLDDVLGGEPPKEKLAAVLADFTKSAEAARAGALEPLSWRAIFLDAEDLREAKRHLVVVQPELDYSALHAAKEPLLFARAKAREVEAAHPGTAIRFTGKIALNAEELKSVSGGMLWSGALSFVLVALVLGFGIRSGRLVLASLATLFMGLFWTGALGLWMVGHLNIVSVAFAVLFIGLGIDFAIHFVLRYREEFYEGGNRERALSGAAVAVGTPLALCAPTTALAFFAFVPTSYVGLAQLGLIAGAGMFISFLTSLTTLPAILNLMPLKKKPREKHPHAAEEAHFIARHGRAIASSGLALGLVALLAVPAVHFDFDPINLKNREAESVAAFFDLMENEKTSPYAIQVLARDREAAEEQKARLEALPGVREVVGLASFVPAGQEEKLEILEGAAVFMTPVFLNRGLGAPPAAEDDIAEIEAFRAKAGELSSAFPDLELARNALALSAALAGFTAEGAEGAGLRALLAENLFFWFPALLDTLEAGLAAGGIAFEDVPDALTERYVAADGRWRLEVYPRETLAGPKHVAAFVEEVTAAEPDATGTPVQIYNSGRVVKEAMLQASLTAAFLVLGFLYLVTRSARKVGLIVLPVAIAMALTAGAMWAFGIAFNFANVIVLPLLIGLGVDSGIHLVWRAGEEHGAKRVLYTSTPRAVLLSALTTLGSFGTLALSAHKGTASMGILLTISVAAILAATLIVLPGLMAWLQDRKKARKA